MSAITPVAYDQPYAAQRPAFLWLLEREVVRFLKIWHFSVVGRVLAAMLFLVIFGVALKNKMGLIDGVAYDRYILPGLLVQAVFVVGFINGTTSLFEARNDRYIHGVFASPLRWWEINLALVLGSVVREIMVAAGLLLAAGPLVGGELARPLLFVFAMVALFVSSAQLGVITGTYARSLDDIHSFENLFLVPLTFLSGTFYAVGGLGGGWRLLNELNPVYYFVEATRFAMLGKSYTSSWVSLVVVAALTFALCGWSLALFRSARRLKP